MYRINALNRPTLITTDEVIAKSATDSNPDVRMILQNIELAEERFIANAMGDEFYEDFISKKNTQVTPANQASLLILINASRSGIGRAPVLITDIPVGTWINAIELVTDTFYVQLWDRFLWRLTAECVDCMTTVPSWLRHTAQGQMLNNPAIIGSGTESASGSAKDVKFKIDVQISSRIDPFRERMELWICNKKRSDINAFPLYQKCECADDQDGISYKRKTAFVFGIYDDDKGCGECSKVPAGIVPVPPDPGQMFAYWLARDNDTPPTDSEILNIGIPVAITPGQPTIIYDLTGLSSDKWIFLCEPVGEPVKTYKYCSVADQEYLGDDAQFNVRISLSTFAYYKSNFPTSNGSYPIQLKTTA